MHCGLKRIAASALDASGFQRRSSLDVVSSLMVAASSVRTSPLNLLPGRVAIGRSEATACLRPGQDEDRRVP
jgi:hypothetical protein